jgi:hypothetical protein
MVSFTEEMQMWELQPTPRRRQVADLIMEMLRDECAGVGGAADAAAALYLALAETIMANTVADFWEGLFRRIDDRIREEVDRIVNTAPEKPR